MFLESLLFLYHLTQFHCFVPITDFTLILFFPLSSFCDVQQSVFAISIFKFQFKGLGLEKARDSKMWLILDPNGSDFNTMYHLLQFFAHWFDIICVKFIWKYHYNKMSHLFHLFAQWFDLNCAKVKWKMKFKTLICDLWLQFWTNIYQMFTTCLIFYLFWSTTPF